MNTKTTSSSEGTINDALGEVLQPLGRGWTVRHEDTKAMSGGKRPDVLIEKGDGYPIVIEAEVGKHKQAELEAVQRLGESIVGGHDIHAAVALVYPDDIRRHSGEALRKALQRTSFEYIMLTLEPDEATTRFPTEGWLTGDLKDLAILIHRSGMPASLVNSLANTLDEAVQRAEAAFTRKHPRRSGKAKAVADAMGQTDDEGGQTRRMAMAVVANAMTFHAILSASGMEVENVKGKVKQRPVRSPEEAKKHGQFMPSEICDEWERILKVNYWPIFHFAREIIRSLSPQPAADILSILWQAAEQLIAHGAAKSHDLTGMVFQRMIKDRQFLASYYTKPSSAALLAGLALPVDGRQWDDAKSLSTMRIGDFSCGTGTLLSAAYQRFGMLHEIAGGDPGELHPGMMENGLVGLDILNIAVHLTSSMLAGTHPDRPFAGDCLLTMPYGTYQRTRKAKTTVSIGSLELLEDEEGDQANLFPVMDAAAKTAGGSGEQRTRNYIEKVKHDSFDMVIMNPPFTRATVHEGEVADSHNPAFAAFETSEEEQKLMAKRAKQLVREGAGHGNAGLGSYFIDLGHLKTKLGGVLALVLPKSALSGISWASVRNLWREQYGDIMVVTTADGSSFSADTNMGECIFVGKKKDPHETTDDVSANFVVLNRAPNNAAEGEALSKEIERIVASQSIRKLSRGVFGGTHIIIGDEVVGEMLQCPIPDGNRPWPVAGIRQMNLAQAADRLERGIFQFDGRIDEIPMPICRIADLCQRDDNDNPKIGPLHRDLSSPEKTRGSGRFRAPFNRIAEVSASDPYPMLWAHNAERERCMIVDADSCGEIRDEPPEYHIEYTKKANALWDGYASVLHYNLGVRFNSQSILVARTVKPVLGGSAWPSVILKNDRWAAAFTLWCNSTLGLLAHWWGSNRTQLGRGIVTITSTPTLCTLDTSKLPTKKLKTADRIFGDLANKRLLPMNQLAEDPVRAEIDHRLLTEVLDLSAAAEHIDRLRHALANEPSIHGGKKSKVVFTKDGEEAQKT